MKKLFFKVIKHTISPFSNILWYMEEATTQCFMIQKNLVSFNCKWIFVYLNYFCNFNSNFLQRYLDQDELDMSRADDRHFILQIALKCADISNPCRPWDVSRKWSQKVCEEFFRQGDYERQLNLPVTSLCDRHSTSVPKIQAGV